MKTHISYSNKISKIFKNNILNNCLEKFKQYSPEFTVCNSRNYLMKIALMVATPPVFSKSSLAFILLSQPCSAGKRGALQAEYGPSRSWLIMIIDNIPGWQTTVELHGAHVHHGTSNNDDEHIQWETYCSRMQLPRGVMPLGGEPRVYNQYIVTARAKGYLCRHLPAGSATVTLLYPSIP